MKIGILSDIHEDAERLEPALRLLEKRNCDELICLGDIIGFDVRHYRYLAKRDASRCLAMVRANCRLVLAGNHDLFAIRKTPRANGLFAFPENWYQLDFSERKKLGEDRIWLFEHQELSPLLSAADRDYIDSLPEFLMADFAGTRVLFSHEIFPDPSGSLTWRPKNHWDFRQHFNFMQENRCRLGVSGHLHPDGIGIVHDTGFHFSRFRAHAIPPDLVQYVCPCMANSASRNGFLILDTVSMTMEAVALKSKPYRVEGFR